MMFQPVLKDIDVMSTIERLENIEFEGFLEQSGEFVADNIRIRLQSGVNPDGSQFTPLRHPAYAAWKEKNYPGRPVMTLTGELLHSITEQTAGGDMVLIGAEGAHTRIDSLGRLADQFPDLFGSHGEESFDSILMRQEAWGRDVMDMSESDVAEVESRFVSLFDEVLA